MKLVALAMLLIAGASQCFASSLRCVSDYYENGVVKTEQNFSQLTKGGTASIDIGNYFGFHVRVSIDTASTNVPQFEEFINGTGNMSLVSTQNVFIRNDEGNSGYPDYYRIHCDVK